MSALWVAVVAINGALALVVFYSWLCGSGRDLRPEVGDDQVQVLGLRSAA